MLKHIEITKRRLRHFASDAGLRGRLYPRRAPVALSVYSAPDRISYADAMRGDYRPARVGEQFGPVWSTHWFRVDIRIPDEWREQEVHLLFNTNSEGCIWENGQPLQGLTGTDREGFPIRHQFVLQRPTVPMADGRPTMDDRRPSYVVRPPSTVSAAERTLYIEVACNRMFGLENLDERRIGWLEQAEIAVFDRGAWDLLWDFVVVADMAQYLPADTPRAGQALYNANAMVNACNLDDRRTWPATRQLAAKFLAERNGDGQHNISAIGHAHIDTAWLWPLAETKRKCVRTFTTALRYMEDDPEYRFVCSQAQQYAWIKEAFPDLFERIRARVKEGRFIPAGGTWVEPDCNIPSGESLVRQFLHGQRFFRREFGISCQEFWNPDVFGYSGALPQIIRGAGMDYFLTQKLSWNQFNKPASHTFFWEGIDGSRVLTHFPPADTYNGMANVEEMLFNVRNFKDHERARESYYLFGYGDGGGGPTLEMLEQLKRMRDVDGLPRITQRSPAEFFARCAADVKDATTWVGELYFELHRGTYTSQARNKLNNRRSEWLLHDAEFLSAVGLEAGTYPSAELERLWKLVLLNQFHDIIPGSSIDQVYRDSDTQYAEIAESGGWLREQAVRATVASAERTASSPALPPLGSGSETPSPALLAARSGALPEVEGGGGGRLIAINTLSVPRTEVVELPSGVPAAQQSSDGEPLGIVTAPPLGYAVQAGTGDLQGNAPVQLTETSATVILENAFVRATFLRDGALLSLFDKHANREAISPGQRANQFMLFDDEPVAWDAWDVDVFHLEKRDPIGAATSMKITERGPLRASLVFTYRIGVGSALAQTVSLNAISARLDFACEADWHERHKFLKVEFPIDVRSEQATYEIQFGHVQRPTHFNTSWDLARFEVCAHRWADLSEPDFGVALLNDCKYGHAVHGNVMRLSLLRAPTYPDPQADLGHHAFRFALLPHRGTFREGDVVAEGYRFNVPLIVRTTKADAGAHSTFMVNNSSVIIDTIKKAEDEEALIVRLYEAHGTRGRVRLSSALPITKASRCNLIEDELEALEWNNNGVDLDFTPFKVLTVKLT